MKLKKYIVSLKVDEELEVEAEDEDEAYEKFQEWFENVYPQATEVKEIKG